MTGRRLEDLPDCLSVEEAASFLRIGRNSAYAAVASGELRVVRIGRRLIVPKSALEQLLSPAGLTGIGPAGAETRP